MRIKSITIELDLEKGDIDSHATVINFSNGTWVASGPLYSRLTPMLHEVWKTIKTAVTANQSL